MNTVAFHPGVTVEQVQDNTGYEPAFKPDIGVTERPTELTMSPMK